jgi:hypothetical protein
VLDEQNRPEGVHHIAAPHLTHCCDVTHSRRRSKRATQHHRSSRHADLSCRSPLNLQIHDTAQGSDPLLPSRRRPTRLPGTADTLPVTQHTAGAALTLPRPPLVDPLPETHCCRSECRAQQSPRTMPHCRSSTHGQRP